MKIISDKFLHFDNIIWQVDAMCSNKCKGCYLQELDWDEFVLPPYIIADQLSDLFHTGRLMCNQFTISLDKDLCHDDIKREAVTQLLDTLHTFNKSHITLSAYDLLGLDCAGYPIRDVDSIAVSKLPSLGYAHSKDPWTSKPMPEIVLQHLYDKAPLPLSKNMNRMYLLFRKPPLGDRIEDLKVKLSDFTTKYYSLLTNRYNTQMDLCINNIEYKKACHGGIHTATVWPDGSVTGCPYDTYCRYGAHTMEIPSLLDRFKHVDRLGSPYKICALNKKNNGNQ